MDEHINNCWIDISSRIHIWDLIYEKENNKINLNENENKTKLNIKLRLLKVYELVVIFSSLSCAALVGISDSTSNNNTVIIIHDCVRGYGIVSSSLGAIVSLSNCMIISALPQQYIMEYLHIFMKYSNIPVLTSVFSIFSMMLCASLQFKNTVMIIVLPYSFFCFFYSLYVYDNLRRKMIKLIEKNNENKNTI